MKHSRTRGEFPKDSSTCSVVLSIGLNQTNKLERERKNESKSKREKEREWKRKKKTKMVNKHL